MAAHINIFDQPRAGVVGTIECKVTNSKGKKLEIAKAILRDDGTKDVSISIDIWSSVGGTAYARHIAAELLAFADAVEMQGAALTTEVDIAEGVIFKRPGKDETLFKKIGQTTKVVVNAKGEPTGDAYMVLVDMPVIAVEAA